MLGDYHKQKPPLSWRVFFGIPVALALLVIYAMLNVEEVYNHVREWLKGEA